MLQQEKNYDFKKRLLTVHKSNIRDFSIIANENDYEIKDNFKIIVPKELSVVLETGAKDFLDYLSTSMKVSASVIKGNESHLENAIVINIEKSQKEDYIISFDDIITLTARTDRGAVQALYCLEDMMNVRKSPFIRKEEIRHTFMFSPEWASIYCVMV